MADTITTWTQISAPTDFRDDAVFEVDFKTKTVQVLVEQPIVAGENKSQFIKFQMGRYYDAIDPIMTNPKYSTKQYGSKNYNCYTRYRSHDFDDAVDATARYKILISKNN